MNDDANNKMTDLIPKMCDTLKAERFYGKTVLKWEAGEVTLVQYHRDLKRDGVKKLIN